MNLEYIIMRLVRRNLPDAVIRFMLSRGLIIKPGIETLYPDQAVERYENEFAPLGRTITDSSIMIFGYGGFFGTAVRLLEKGAKHVYLCDKYASPDTRRNSALLRYHRPYVYKRRRQVLPNPRFITLLTGDICDSLPDLAAGQIDIVLSLHVLEHVRDVDETVRALAQITPASGINLHFIGIMDHFFKYPFHMLCYSRKTWERFLNPGSNLNRLRLRDYEIIFRKYFANVLCKITRSDPDSFRKVQGRIKPEFITGDDSADSATEIVVAAWGPIGGSALSDVSRRDSASPEP